MKKKARFAEMRDVFFCADKKRLKSVKIVDETLFNSLHGELGCTKEDVISTCETLGIKNEIKKGAIQQRFAFYYEKSKNTMTALKNQYC